MPKYEIGEYVKNSLDWSLDAALKYAQQTTNPIDDILVRSACIILRKLFNLKEVD